MVPPPEFWVLLVAASPFAELRGAIPLALVYGMDPAKAALLSVVGNLLPVLPILLLLGPAVNFFHRWRFFARIIDTILTRTRRKSGSVQTLGPVGLALFVAIPLPLTGAWTGCLVAFLLGMPLRRALPAIAAGVLGAAAIVMAVVYGGFALLRPLTGL